MRRRAPQGVSSMIAERCSFHELVRSLVRHAENFAHVAQRDSLFVQLPCGTADLGCASACASAEVARSSWERRR